MVYGCSAEVNFNGNPSGSNTALHSTVQGFSTANSLVPSFSSLACTTPYRPQHRMYYITGTRTRGSGVHPTPNLFRSQGMWTVILTVYCLWIVVLLKSMRPRKIDAPCTLSWLRCKAAATPNQKQQQQKQQL